MVVCRYGEPVVSGYTRSFGQRLPNGERYEFIKPIMFTAGVGSLNSLHAKKGDPAPGESSLARRHHDWSAALAEQALSVSATHPA